MRYHKEHGQLVCGIPKKFKVYIKDNLFKVVKGRNVFNFSADTKIISEYVNKHFYPIDQQSSISDKMTTFVENL